MLYRIHSASVSSNSFEREQGLIERLELFDTYSDEGYLTNGQLRVVRMQIIYTALKRMANQLGARKLESHLNLLSVCRRALRS
jgi:hypothetical protein